MGLATLLNTALTRHVIENVVSDEISQLTDAEIKKYGFEKKKLMSEGSTWLMYQAECMQKYYEQNKERIDKIVNNMLDDAKIK